jgi:uncharacterized membrane protein YgdD (TMEM256/DUF423 family)
VSADRALAALGGLLGAAGVALLALAAHGPFQGLAPAAEMTLCHAPALLGVAALCHLGVMAPRLGRLAGFGLALGVALFSGDIALHATTGSRLFPMAAPTGGSLTIAAWLGLAAAAMLGRRR